MKGRKSPQKLFRKSFCLLKPVSDAMQSLVKDLECRSYTEVVRRSVMFYDDYRDHLNNKEYLVSIGKKLTELIVPKYDFGNEHKRWACAFNIFYVKILNKHRKLYGSTYQKTVSDSIMLVDLITNELDDGKSIGYKNLNSAKIERYELFLPVKYKAQERLRRKKGKIFLEGN